MRYLKNTVSLPSHWFYTRLAEVEGIIELAVLIGAIILEVYFMSKYAGKLAYSSFEWDMPTHEHFNIGILGDESEVLAAIKTFEYRFSSKNSIEDFNAKDIAAWEAAGDTRQNQTHQDAIAALTWLETHYPDSRYGMLNHPRRYLTSYTIKDVRELNDAAPNVFFLVEGLKPQYFRLRGTNLDYNQANLTEKGNPLKSAVINQAEDEAVQTWYNKINERNYDDLWFYSNPVFVNTRK